MQQEPGSGSHAGERWLSSVGTSMVARHNHPACCQLVQDAPACAAAASLACSRQRVSDSIHAQAQLPHCQHPVVPAGPSLAQPSTAGQRLEPSSSGAAGGCCGALVNGSRQQAQLSAAQSSVPRHVRGTRRIIIACMRAHAGSAQARCQRKLIPITCISLQQAVHTCASTVATMPTSCHSCRPLCCTVYVTSRRK